METVVTQSSHPIISVVPFFHIRRHLFRSALGESAERSIEVIG